MTIDRETVIRLAREADGEECTGWRDNGDPERYYEFWPEQLERFAALVLEHGRKPLTEDQWVQSELFKLAVRNGLISVHTELVAAPQTDPKTKVSWMDGHARACDVSNEAAHGITSKESSDAE